MSEVRSIDAAVVGAGVVGLTAALGLAQQGFKIALIGPRVRVHEPNDAALFDARIYAVAPATVALLEQLSVWKRVDAARTNAIQTMRVFGCTGATH